MWLQGLVAKFGPVTERADNTTVLDFERPLAELDSRIREVRSSAFSLFFGVGVERLNVLKLCCSRSRGRALDSLLYNRAVKVRERARKRLILEER